MRLPAIKIQLIIFLIAFAGCLSIINKETAFLSIILIAVTSAITVDSCIGLIKTKKFTITDSSIITGLIVGYVLSGIEPWWVFALAPSLAIASKHLFRIDKRHIFNPAAFGIFSATVLFGASTQWRGASAWYIIVPFGVYFVSKIHKIGIVAGYMAASLILFAVRAGILNTPLLDILVYQNYFFIFVMLIEPKTTPAGKWGKVIFGSLTALSVFILTVISLKFDAELVSLLILNLFVPMLNKGA